MMRRVTLACGLLTMVTVGALALHSGFGARSRTGAAPVSAIPDQPARSLRPPVVPSMPAPHPLPPAPQPAPLHYAPAQNRPTVPQAAKATVDVIARIANTLLNLPKVLGQTR